MNRLLSQFTKTELSYFGAFLTLVFLQSCFWLFANSVEPIVLGMPFGMFFITLFGMVEFALLLLLYRYQEKRK